MSGFRGTIGEVEVSVQVSEYSDGEMRLAVWVGDAMLDPDSARSLGWLLIAAASTCDREEPLVRRDRAEKAAADLLAYLNAEFGVERS